MKPTASQKWKAARRDRLSDEDVRRAAEVISTFDEPLPKRELRLDYNDPKAVWEYYMSVRTTSAPIENLRKQST